MMLAASSSFKGKSDMAKYDKAMKLKGFIEKIRADYTKKLSSSDARTKQVGFESKLRFSQPFCNPIVGCSRLDHKSLISSNRESLACFQVNGYSVSH